jgi:succinate dehydrogenase/fumarate reductase flavoprotein subunit
LDESEVRKLMWKSVGLFRERASLRDCVAVLHRQAAALEDRLAHGGTLDHAGWRRASIVDVALLIARAALRREESRGAHFRIDYPERDDRKWNVHISEVKQT